MADTLNQALLEASLLSSLTEEDDGSLVIDVEKRTIVLPTKFFFGVYNDKDVFKVPFILPRFYGPLDLSEFQISVNYLNSAGYGNVYRVEDAEITDDTIKFKWVTGRGVFVKEGTVRFIVCLRQLSETGEILKEFNTTIASASVLQGLEVDENPDPVAYSILANMEALESSTKGYKDTVQSESASLRKLIADTGVSLRAMVGAPRTAATAAAMTDPTLIYVYTGNESDYTFGNWYYYDGTDFVSGGVYNSTAFDTDETLAISGMAADSAKVGEEISGLKEDLSNLYAGVEGVLTRQVVENIQEIKYKEIGINSLTISDAGGAFYVTNSIPVAEGEMYEITCSGYGNAGAYAFGNNGVLTSAYPQTTASTSEVHIVENEVVVIPHGVTELYLAKYSKESNTITCSKLANEPKKTILVYSDTITNIYTEVPSTNPVRVPIGYNFIKDKEYIIHLKATNVNLQTGVTNQVLLDSSESNSTSVNRLVDVLLRSGTADSVSGTDWTIKYTPTTDTIVALLLRFKTSTGTQIFDVQIYTTVTYSNIVDDVSELRDEVVNATSMIPNQSRMQFGAHRGAESFAPPNCVAAYEIAGKMGFQWAWLAQIRWSSSKTLYVMHDEDVSITTNGTGNLSELTDEYIESLLCNKIQSYDYSKFTNDDLRVPTLEKVIQICLKYGMKMCFRIEPFPADMDTEDNALIWNNFSDLIKEYNIKDGIYSGYSAEELKLCRTLIGDNENLCPFRGNTTTGQDYINFFTNSNITGKRSVLLYYQNATQSDIKLLHKNGIEVYVFYNGTKPSQNEINQWATYGVEILQNPNTPKLTI